MFEPRSDSCERFSGGKCTTHLARANHRPNKDSILPYVQPGWSLEWHRILERLNNAGRELARIEALNRCAPSENQVYADSNGNIGYKPVVCFRRQIGMA